MLEKRYKEYKLRGLLDSKQLYKKAHNEYDQSKTIISDFKSRFKYSEEEFDTLLEKYNDIPFIKSKFTESRKEAFQNDPVDFYDWFKSQENSCGYCGITQEELYKLFNSQLPLNDKMKRSSGTLEIERLDSDSDYSKNNIILACPLCNNAKSNLIDENSWRKLFVLPMRGYYKSRLNNDLVNDIPEKTKNILD